MASTNTTNINSTTIAYFHGWNGSPNGRGTFDIIQICIVTTFLCSWSVLILNLPKMTRHKSKDNVKKNFIHRQLRKLLFHRKPHLILRKARWMVFAIVFPEVITAIASEQWESASQSVEDFKRYEAERTARASKLSSPSSTSVEGANTGAEPNTSTEINTVAVPETDAENNTGVENNTGAENKTETTIAHASPDAALKTKRKNLEATGSESESSSEAMCQWTLRHAFFADMGGFVLESPDIQTYYRDVDIEESEKQCFAVDSQQIFFLVTNGYIDYPAYTEEDIWDKNKADGFARAITAMQTAWFFIQCCGRWAQKLRITTFELSTLAYIYCYIITSCFWWDKPLDIERPLVLRTKNGFLIKDILKNEKVDVNDWVKTPLDFVNKPPGESAIMPFWYCLEVLFRISAPPKIRPVKTFPNSRRTPPRGLPAKKVVAEGFASVVYAAIHLIGWSWPFPSSTEQMLWRITSSILVAILSLYLFFLAVGKIMSPRIAKRFFRSKIEDEKNATVYDVLKASPMWIKLPIFVPVVGLYGVARLYIIAEAFMGLRVLPITAYDSVNWWNYWPHF